MNFRLTTIINILRSCIILIKINGLIFYYSFFHKKKIIFIYHPSKSLTLNHKDYLNDLFNDFGENFFILNIHQVKNLKDKNFYFLNNNFFLKLIFGVNIFLSTYISDRFPPRSIKIYIHHDIYDTPLVNDKKQIELFKRIIKYDYIFLPNQISVNMFSNFFSTNISEMYQNIPKLVEVGYPKLDFLLQRKRKVDLAKKKYLIIAPTNFLSFPDFGLKNELIKLIETILKSTTIDIIYRPHPSNLNHIQIKQIKEKFENNKRFKFDNSTDYFETYIKSSCMITDLSGTAYTYAFLTKCPVIFYSKNESLLKNKNYDNLSYFKDREKIGVIIDDTKEISKLLSNFEDLSEIKKKSIHNLQKDIFNINNSKDKVKNLINDILKK